MRCAPGFLVYHLRLLHTGRAGTTAELVVFGRRWLDHYWQCAQLRIWPYFVRKPAHLAIPLSAGGRSYGVVRCLCVFYLPRFGRFGRLPYGRPASSSHRAVAKGANGRALSKNQRLPGARIVSGHQDLDLLRDDNDDVLNSKSSKVSQTTG